MKTTFKRRLTCKCDYCFDHQLPRERYYLTVLFYPTTWPFKIVTILKRIFGKVSCLRLIKMNNIFLYGLHEISLVVFTSRYRIKMQKEIYLHSFCAYLVSSLAGFNSSSKIFMSKLFDLSSNLEKQIKKTTCLIVLLRMLLVALYQMYGFSVFG